MQHYGTFQHVMIEEEENSFYLLMALISGLLANLILLVLRPFSILMQPCLLGIRIALIVIYTWMELITTAISFPLNITLRIITWTFGLISLPARVLNVFQRERQVSFHSVVAFCLLYNEIHFSFKRF